MKKTAALILLICFAAQTFSQTMIQLSFRLQQHYIAKNLCENRFRPMLHCDGKCVLAKKLRQEQKNDEQVPERKLQGKEEVVSSRSFFTTAVAGISPIGISYHISSDNSIVDRSFAVFRPPC